MGPEPQRVDADEAAGIGRGQDPRDWEYMRHYNLEEGRSYPALLVTAKQPEMS